MKLAKKWLSWCRQRPVFFLLLILLFVLPFLDGGTYLAAETLILILPFPLLLLGISQKELRWERIPNWPWVFWLFFLVFVGLSLAGSASLLLSLPAFFQILAIFLFFCLFLLTASEDNLKKGIGFILAVSFLLCLLSFHFLLPWTGKPASMNLVYATYGHSHLADYLLLAIPLALALFFGARKKKIKLILGGLLSFYLVSFILTFSRGAFLILPPLVFLLVFLSKPRAVFKKFIGWLLVLVPLGLLLLSIAFSLSPFGLKAKFIQPGHWLVRQFVKPEFQARRISYWQQAVEGFFARPLFGFGWGTFELIGFRFQRMADDWSGYTHNFYLQVLSEAGLFALLCFLAFLISAFLLIWWRVKKRRSNPYLLGAFGAILASCLHSLLDYDWHFPAVFLTLLFLLASLLVWRYRRAKEVPFAKLIKALLLGLAFLVFVFGWCQLAGEYFYQKGDYQRALVLSPWPPERARKMGDKIFEDDFSQGEQIGKKLIFFSSADPTMNSWMGDKYFDQNKKEKAVGYYHKTIIYDPFSSLSLYQRAGEIYDELGKEEEKESLYQFFLQRVEKKKAYRRNSSRLAKALYLIGEDYLHQGDKEAVIVWWEEAIEPAPEWSYFHIELASLYLSLGKTEEAEAVLSACTQLCHPRFHCQEYLRRLSGGKAIEPPGFWHSRIIAIPDY